MMAIALPVGIVAAVGAACGLLLSIADKYMAVPVDERVTKVRELLPGANCGGCGYAGCDEYAEKIVNDGAPANLCAPGGAGTVQAIGNLLGVSAGEIVAKTAIVCCSGTIEHTEYIMEYEGPKTCEACNFNYQGRGSCSYACLGFGDCVAACRYGAIQIVNGVAVVEKALCTGCGACAKSCPNHLIRLQRADKEVFVGCSSHDKGAFTRRVCKAGCIGCMKCQKICRYGAIVVTQNLASIDPQKCTGCRECVGECPTGVIKINECENQKESGAPISA